MSKRTRLLLRENNALESELSREEDREVLTDITVYLRTANISQYYQERVRRDIWQMLVDGERRGETAREVLGEDHRAFCDSVVAELPQLSRTERVLSQLRDVLLSAVVLFAIWLALGLLEQLIRPETMPYLTVTAGNAVCAAIILAAAFLLVHAVSRNAFSVDKAPGKRGFAVMFALVFLLMLACMGANIFIKYALFQIHALAAAAGIAALLAVYLALEAKLD